MQKQAENCTDRQRQIETKTGGKKQAETGIDRQRPGDREADIEGLTETGTYAKRV